MNSTSAPSFAAFAFATCERFGGKIGSDNPALEFKRKRDRDRPGAGADIDHYSASLPA